MVAAMNAVKHGEMGLNEAATAHDIPKTTLKDRISGRVTHGINPGPRQCLDKNEEKELSTFLKDYAAIGYGKTRREVMCIAQSAAMENGVLRKDRITLGWWQKFVQRQGDLSLR